MLLFNGINTKYRDMITNYYILIEVVNSLDARTKKRILNTLKDYVIIEIHIFNVGCYATAKVTNTYKECEHPKYLFLTEEIQDILNNQ